MSSEVKYVYEDELVEDAARNMKELQLRRLPVLNRDKRLVGIISLGDVAAKKPGPAGEALRGITRKGAAKQKGETQENDTRKHENNKERHQ